MWMSLAPSFAACVSSALSMRMIGASLAASSRSSTAGRSCIMRDRSTRALDLADHRRRARLAAGVGRGDALRQRGRGLALERVDVVEAQHLGQRRQRRRLRRPQHEALAVVFEQQRVRLGEGVGQGVAGAHGCSVGCASAGSGSAPAPTAGGRQRRAAAVGCGSIGGTGPRCSGEPAAGGSCGATGASLIGITTLGRGCAVLLLRADQVVAVQRQLVRVGLRRASPSGAGRPSGWCVVLVRLSLRNSAPTQRQVAEQRHLGSCCRCSSSSIRPPSTMIWPSSTTTVDLDRALVGDRAGVARCRRDVARRLEFSWKIVMRIVPPSPICGLMRSVMPTSLRSMVWNGLVGAGAGVGELAGDERHVLADDDLRLLVVERDQVRRRRRCWCRSGSRRKRASAASA